MKNCIDLSQIARDELGVNVAAGESKKLGPEQLFLAAWLLVPMVIADPSKLHQWPSWSDYNRGSQLRFRGYSLPDKAPYAVSQQDRKNPENQPQLSI